MAVGKGVAENIPGSSPSLRRVYVVNKEICVRTVCAHEELLRGRKASTPCPGSAHPLSYLAVFSLYCLAWDTSQTHLQAGAGPPSSLHGAVSPTLTSPPFTADLCRDKFSKCGVMAVSGLCQSVAASCARSCGGC